MKRNRLYRIGAGLLAGLLVFTGVPQTYSFAEETKKADDETAAYIEMQNVDSLIGEEDIDPIDNDMQIVDLQEEGDDPPAPLVTGIKLNVNELTLQRNETEKLTYTLTPTGARDTVTFKSSAPSIASVDETTGVVTGVAVPENGLPVTITARTGANRDIVDTCMVTVTPIPVETVTVDQANLELTAESETAGTLKVYVNPKDADDREIKVSSTNSAVATVEYTKNTTEGKNHDYDIKVTPLKEGTAYIRVISMSNAKAYASCKVLVKRKTVALEKLILRPTKLSMIDSETLHFKLNYLPAYTTQTEVTCAVTKVMDDASENSDAIKYNDVKVSLDEDGNGTLHSNSLPTSVTERKVTVRAASTKDNTIYDEFTVSIKRKSVPAESLTVITKELVLADGGANQTGVVELRVNPTDSTDRTIIAEVADNKTDIVEVTESATVNALGIAKFTLTGKKPGNCKITFRAGGVTTTDGVTTGGVTAEFPVTVDQYVAPIDKLELESSLEITELDHTKTLTAEIEPLQAEDKKIKWSVSDPEVVTILGLDEDDCTTADKTGTPPNEKLTSTVKIAAHMVGDCDVTATAAGGVSKTCKIKVVPGSPAVTGLTIATEKEGIGSNPEKIYIRQGQSITFNPTVTPAGANEKVRWSSGGSDVVSLSVDEDSACAVTADHTGICTVTAQASGIAPECKKQIEIHVVKPRLDVEAPEDFSFAPDQLPIEKNMITDRITVRLYKYDTPSLQEDATVLTGEEYELGIVAENGKSVRPYDPKDMEKAGTKMLVISCDYENETIEYPERVLVVMTEFSDAELVSITPLSGNEADVWNVPNGTPASSLPLAKTVEITVKGVKSGKIAKADTDIQWNLNAIDYDANSAEAQEFVVYGTVKLPEYVKNIDKISLDVKATVHVREEASSGKKVEAPRFSILGGEKIESTAVEVPYGSKIVIESDTEEAVIYYMLDQRPDGERGIPQDEEHRYKSPIEITAKTSTIYAIATKEGYSNSGCSECTVKLIKGEVDIPDDPDDPEPDQVVDTDRPTTGKIPSGLWVALQPDEYGRKDDFPYTGSAIKPVIRVYSHTTMLTEKKDYTISYKNNINAREKGAANAPCIIVKGKGNYSGETKISFTIKPQSIDDDSVLMDEYVAVAYNKKEQKLNPSLLWNGKKLTKGKDFTVTDRVYKEPKKYDVTVTGIGNFTETRKMTYEIFSGGVSVSKLSVSKIPNQKCTGEAITPSVVVKYKNTVLQENANYTVKYKNNIEVGTASVIITGLGNYKGTRRIDFKITAMAKISDAGFTMVFDPAVPVYNGAPVKPVSYKAVYKEKELKEGLDYKVSYANNNKAGTASLILTGIGRFNGTAKKNYKIQSGDLGKGITVEMAASFPYEKGGCKPKPKVISGNYILQEGKDYSLTYSNNKAVGNNASVTIKGKGSFKGTIIKQFAVTRQNIENLQVVAADKIYRNKRNIYRTSVKVIDLNGKALVAGKDYDKEMYYSYADGPKQGEQVLPTDLIPMGTILRVEVRVSNPKNYIGKAYGLYRIVQADISKAKVKVDPQEYTGRMKKPGKDQIHVTLNGVILGDSDYEIEKYENNVNQGTAKVTIRGIGRYGGTKTVNFKIQKRELNGLTF